MEKQLKILGYTTDFNKCDCCGRSDLKGTVAVLDLIYDTVLHYGTTCAYHADKYDTLDAAKKAKKDVNRVMRDYNGGLIFVKSFCIAKKVNEVDSAKLIADYKAHKASGNKGVFYGCMNYLKNNVKGYEFLQIS